MLDSQIDKVIDENEHIILFDGLCNLCSGWVHFLIERDPKEAFKFCSVQSQTGKALLQYLGLSTDQIETMAYFHRGKGYVRSAAFLQLVKRLPSLWPLISIGVYVPEVVRDKLYNHIAKNRYKIAGKRDSCLMPTENNKARFI
jgi:predicted DCC family thiol-disulfide oxidoreductase YuxK